MQSRMASVKPRKLFNPYERGIADLVRESLEKDYLVYQEVGLSKICEIGNGQIDWELRNFWRSASSVDILVTDLDANPCLVVEAQSTYHDQPDVKERDKKKAILLSLAGIPLIYTRVYLPELHILNVSSQEKVTMHLYTKQGLTQAKELIHSSCKLPNS